jgi:hypothetical protein
VLPLDRAKRKSRGFTMYVDGGRKGACERGVDGGCYWRSDRMNKKEC